MTTTFDTASFVIFHRDNTGKPDFVYPWDRATATYVVAVIVVCRGMLPHESTRRILIRFAIKFNQSNGMPSPSGKTVEHLAIEFIIKMLRDFPLLGVDGSLTNPDHRARGFRKPWDNDFLPHEHCILFNERVNRRYLYARAS